MNPVATPPNVLDQLVKRARRLYTLPAVAMRVVELTGEPSIDVAALKECIQNDPALTSKILRVVNSSLFGLPAKVGDLSQALALIGSKPLKLMVLGFSLPDELLSNLESDILERYWRHALVKAVAAREISELVWKMPGDEAFLAGLLQDVGMLVLIQDLGRPYVTFLDQVWSVGGDLAALETSTLGFDHGVLSARLLEAWGLPDSLVHSIAQPFDVERLARLPQDEQALPRILHLAEIVAVFLSQDRAELLNGLLDVGRQYHDMTIGQVDELIDALENNVPPLADILAVRLSQSDYRTILMQAHAQLAGAADEATDAMRAGSHGPDASEPSLQDAALQDAALQDATFDLSGAVQRLATAADPTLAFQPRLVTPVASATPQSPSRGGPAVASRPATNDPGILGHVTGAIAHCRKLRCAVSLALLELDEYESLFLTHGVEGVLQTVERLRSALAVLLDGEGHLLQADEARFAVILPDCDRQQAVELIRHLVQGVRRWSAKHAANRGSIRSISAGLATLAMPPQNFPTQELIDAAQRCLDGVQLSGGDSVKSIDI